MPYYVVGPDGRESGPFELDVLIGWARAGQLPRSAPVRNTPGGTAVQAGEMIELSSHFPAADYSHAPGPAGSTGSAMMPSGNPDALWGYYLGFASLICCIGLPVTPIAIVRSVRGLRKYKESPEVYGKAHAIVGIVLACIGGVGNLFLVGLFVANLGRA